MSLTEVEAQSRRRALPILGGAEHLKFRCSGCGECCRSLRVTVTHHDLRRLAGATGEPFLALVDWLNTDEVDMTDEPGSFVELRGGRRLMVLAQRDGACRWLDADQRCAVYAARPLDCRLFPFHFESERSETGVRLSLLELGGCEYEHDGCNDPEELWERDSQRWRELSEYQAVVARWNRLARHRLRLGRGGRVPEEFIEFLFASA